jgi:hypothetical protein
MNEEALSWGISPVFFFESFCSGGAFSGTLKRGVEYTFCA